MRRLLLVLAIGLAATSPAYAQIADALGRPLPASELPTGTISVKVIAGMVTKPVIGADVTLLVNGTPRVARTDSEGRAQFPDLPPGATVQAKVLDEDQKEVTSHEFPVPEDGGARVMVTTKPFQPLGGGGGAPFAGGGGMPDPRQVSGEPRPEQKNAAGELTVLVCYGELKDVVENIPVTLVGYAWDGNISVKVAQTGKDGRVRFADLDHTGSTSYYALAELPRNGATDRLMSFPVELDSQVGVAMLLSGDKRASTSPPIDEFTRYEPQPPLPAGKVRIPLRGLASGSQPVELVDAQTAEVVGHAQPVRGEAEITNIEPSAEYDPRTDEPPGTFDITLHGGSRGQADKPLPNVELSVAPAGDASTPPAVQRTDANGKVHFTLPAGSYTVAVALNDKPLTSAPFDLTKGGGDLSVGAVWDASTPLEADFDIDPHTTRTLYARTLGKGGATDVYRTLPFHVLADRGNQAPLLVVPHVVFRFQMVSEVDDVQLAVRGIFEVTNLTWAPYKNGPDGLLIPLPEHFKGALITENEQQIAAVDPQGFRLMHPLSPMRTQFHGGFTLPTQGGDVNWQMDLPLGAIQSGLRIVPFAGMKVDLPRGVQSHDATMQDGTTLFDIPNISIERGKSMVLTIHGLPSQPAWKVWLPRIVGVVVVMTMLGGLGFAFAARRKTAAPAADPARDARRTRLMDELVELDRGGATSGKDRKRRDALLAELEKLWD